MSDPLIREAAGLKPQQRVTKNNDTIFLNCECGSEALEVYADKEWKTFDFCVWERRHKGLTLFDRAKLACRILFLGEIYGDQIMFDEKEVMELTEFLLAKLKEQNENNKKGKTPEASCPTRDMRNL